MGGGGGNGGIKPSTKFSKGGDDRISIFKGGLLGKRGELFQEVQFLHKKIQFEIINDKNVFLCHNNLH